MKRSPLSLFICLTIFLTVWMGGVAWTGSRTYEEITAPEVKSMIQGGKAVVVHVLSKIEYDMQHITGSINIPIIKVKASDKLPKDRDTALIFYCMGKR